MTGITKHLRRVGLLLTTPIEHRMFAPESTELYVALRNDLTVAMFDYNKKPTKKRFRAWTPLLPKMDREAKALFDHANTIGGDESGILLWFLLQRVTPFTEGWAEVFAALEAGEEITIQPINTWIWSPLEAQPQ
jgi:hypothetical protein